MIVRVTLLLTLPAVAAKVALVAPAPIVTEPGTGRAALLLASETTAPPLGAGFESVTEQEVVEPGARFAGAKDTELGTVGAIKDSVAVCDTPSVPVITAV